MADIAEQVRVLGKLGPAGLDAPLGHALVHVVPKGLGELRLSPVQFDDPRQGRHIGERAVDGGRGNALPGGLGTQSRQPGLESLVGARRVGQQ